MTKIIFAPFKFYFSVYSYIYKDKEKTGNAYLFGMNNHKA